MNPALIATMVAQNQMLLNANRQRLGMYSGVSTVAPKQEAPVPRVVYRDKESNTACALIVGLGVLAAVVTAAACVLVIALTI